jgi:acetylornithine deacetylase/succinyl-diaminopimelate desuccinylase-like protein
MRLRTKSSWIAIAVLVAAFAHAQIQFKKLAPEQVEKRLDAAATTQAERGAYLRKEFQAAGCATNDVKDDPVAHEKQPNIICVIPGKSARQIIVGAHYDFVTEGRGIVDNWSGAALLPSFVESLKNDPREHTFIFIAFTGEEDGLVGSKSYVSHLSKEQRQNVAAMVNLDTLGLSATKVWSSHSSKILVNALFSVASSTNSPLSVMNVDDLAKNDGDSFRDANIPEICVHSVTQETFKILHSRSDQMSAIRRNDYYETYRLMASYLAAIDASLDSTGSKN